MLRLSRLLLSAAGRQPHFAVGDCVKARRAFSDADVRQFAVLSGDTNAIHLDEAYAAQSRFGQRVVHGILLSSMFSGLVGSRLPGPGSVYLSQTLQFHSPVFLDEPIDACVTVKAIETARRVVTLTTECYKADGTLAISGVATALYPRPSASKVPPADTVSSP